MKRFLLLIISLIALTALALSFSVTAFAAEDAEEVSEQLTEESDIVTEEDGNAFSEIYTLLLSNSDKLLSALAFLSSLLIVFTYKKGLIPIINTGLSAIKKNVDSFGGAAANSLEATAHSLDFLTDKFASSVNTLEGLSKHVDELSEKLQSLESEKNAGQTLKTVMLAQIDMLYEIFMNSAMPQYSKDALGEKVAKMKKSISLGEENA